MTSKSCVSKVLDNFPEVLAQHQRAEMLIYFSKIFGCSCVLHHTASLFDECQAAGIWSCFSATVIKKEKDAEGESVMI